MIRKDDKKFLEELVQDMKVRVRDMNDFRAERRYKKVIAKFQEGIESEYGKKAKKQ
ncbi:MAG: hypothetical protein ACTSWY_15255 [Promethearchaeota archaeon]